MEELETEAVIKRDRERLTQAREEAEQRIQSAHRGHFGRNLALALFAQASSSHGIGHFQMVPLRGQEAPNFVRCAVQ